MLHGERLIGRPLRWGMVGGGRTGQVGYKHRTGALRDGMVVDLSGAFAKYASEKLGEAHPVALAGSLVPWDLARFIEGGERTLDNAEKALAYLFGEAQDKRDRRGESERRSRAACRAAYVLGEHSFDRLGQTSAAVAPA